MMRTIAGKRIHGEGAAAQASAAHAMLVLMGDLDFSRLSEDLRTRYLNDIFRWSCYALAGLPVMQRAILATHPEFDTAESFAAIVRTSALLFGIGPEEADALIVKMLGMEGAAVQ